MTPKKFFLILFRVFFVLFSLKYLYDAFYKWDGYSFYLRFSEVLPDFSLAFILWSIFTVILAFIFWIGTCLLFKFLTIFKKTVRFEHTIAWAIIVALIFAIKKGFNSFENLSGSMGAGRFFILATVAVLVTVIVWSTRKFIEKYTEKIFLKINGFVTPLVWVFVLLMILTVPISIFTFTRKYPEATPPSNNGQVKERPNIILITMDGLSARDMSVYGYSRPTTPFISEWAKNAVLFKRAYSSSNWTPPTTMTLMTGQRPWVHKNWHLTYNWPFRRYEQNLPKLLKDHGYATYAFVQNFNAHPNALGVGDAFLVKDEYHTFMLRPPGFEGRFYNFINYIEDKTKSRIAISWVIKHPLFSPIWFFYPIDREKTSIPPEKVYNRFLEHISKKSQQPFFAWLHLEIPHYPFLPPKPYMGMFGDGDKFNTEQKQFKTNLLGQEYELERQNEVDILKKRQDEYILYADQAFKLFLSCLNKTVDVSNTIIILSADHGTSMSRGLVGHGFHWFYENITNIPLIIKMPDSNKRINGRVIDIPIEQVDIPPTILEIAGIPVPEWMEGRSLLPLLEGKSFEPRPVFSMELGRNRVLGDFILRIYSIAVWDKYYKLIYYEGWPGKETELFDLKSDPNETKNIIHDEPEVAKKLLKLIESKLSQATKREYTLPQ
jgi:arylsulfatase A-like enzyme